MPQTPVAPAYEPPSGRRLAVSALVAVVAAAVVLVAFVLPAEYGVDPLGIGRALGLTALEQPARTIEIVDVVGGNEQVVEAEIPDFGEPVPLPNPAVHQAQAEPAGTETLEITIPPEGETEVKLWMDTSKSVVYSWSVDRGTIYSDFHGHTPDAGPNFFVRYIEHQETNGGNGSLAAPFAGEHGWYWLNYNDFPVTVTLSVTGYYEDIIDYGIF
ncbi:MAG: hypothetical protein JXB36_08980 [Gammaproteobacteria bacterium]|nr:hypothetical protein [Gammaproteobacteria bacterium]